MHELERLAHDVPAGVEPARVWLGDGRLHVDHDHLIGTRYREPGIAGCLDDEGNPLPQALAAVAGAMRDVRRRHARQNVHASIEGEGMDRPWRDFGRPPSWATMAHPLLAYALRMNGANDLPEGMTQTGSPTPGVRISLVQDLLIGRARMDPSHPMAGKVGCDESGAVLVLHADIPETTRHLLAGRALGALLQLRPCGDPHLDALAGSVLIRGTRTVQADGGIELQMVETKWMPPADVPHGVDMKDVLKEAPVL